MSGTGSGGSSDHDGDTSVAALEEQLTRQKGILANAKLIQKLPDKGAKLRDAVAKLEDELSRRKVEEQAKHKVPVEDIGKLEWALGPKLKISDENSMKCEIDSDDDDDDDDAGEEDEEVKTLKLIATSQITQRQPKVLLTRKEVKSVSSSGQEGSSIRQDVQPDPYFLKFVEKDLNKAHTSKFVPAKALKTGGSSKEASKSEENQKPDKKSANKWDESLLPPTHTFQAAKVLSMEETIQIGCDKYKDMQAMEAIAPKKKKYAYDKLKKEGLGSYTVEMQTTRPVKTDANDDEFIDDLSDDAITEESEPNDSDNDENLQNSKDLSNLVNSKLKLK